MESDAIYILREVNQACATPAINGEHPAVMGSPWRPFSLKSLATPALPLFETEDISERPIGLEASV